MLETEMFDARPRVVNKSKLNILPENPEKAGCSTGGSDSVVGPGRFPSWLHRKIPSGSVLQKTGELLSKQHLHTVCEEAKCPNLLECWSKKTATFLIMGKECTRSCGFCDIDFSKTPAPLDEDEPRRLAESVEALGLKHVVITMVARDDLTDGGAAHLAAVVKAIREKNDAVTIELLTSDLSGDESSIDTVLSAGPEIFNHNIETVRELTDRVRHKARYERTLAFLRYVKKNAPAHTMVKSGIMVGLGESEEQVRQTIRDLKEVGCDIITIGQYLQASKTKLRVKAFIPPAQFKAYEDFGYEIGVSYMYCGPFVRSSYNANLVIQQAKDRSLSSAARSSSRNSL